MIAPHTTTEKKSIMEAKTLQLLRSPRLISPKPKFLYSDYRKLVVSTFKGRSIISYDDIIYAYSSSNYCTIVTKERKITISKTLKWLQYQLDDTFFRVHNSYLISLLEIKTYDAKQNTIVLSDEMNIPISRKCKKSLLNILH